MKPVRLFGGRLKVNLWLIPALAALFALGMGDVVLITIPVLILHEWAHVIAAAALGMTITEMELLPFGCAAKMQCFAMPRTREMIVAAAGPAANMVIASAVFVLGRAGVSIPAADKIIAANVTIAAVNMLPALPLDGGRIARAAFAGVLGSRRATKITAIAGIFFAVVFAGLGVYVLVDGEANPTFLIFGFFLCIMAVKELKSAPYALIRDVSAKRAAIDKRKTLCVNRFAAMHTEKISGVLRGFEANKYNVVTVLGQDMGVVAELDEKMILDAMMERGAHATLRSVVHSDVKPKKLRG